jgi:glutamate synthase (NADPH/NADH) large chain
VVKDGADILTVSGYDGGARTGCDVVKLMLLGANRVGFGTMPMIIIGCTACRQCHLGTCHVGIATQIESVEEAHERGLKHFVPRVKENGIIYEATFFRALGSEIAMLTAKLGFSRTQDLVGRSDLLWQSMRTEDLDLSDLLEVSVCEIQPQPERGVRQLRRPLNYLTSLLSSMITDAFDSGDDEVRFTDDGIKELNDLLLEYHRELLHSFQSEEAHIVSRIMTHSSTGFVKIVAREEEALKNSSIR